MNKKKFGSILAGATMLASCGTPEVGPNTYDNEHYFYLLANKVANEGGKIELPEGMLCDFSLLERDGMTIQESETGDPDMKVALVTIDGVTPPNGILRCMKEGDGAQTISGTAYY